MQEKKIIQYYTDGLTCKQIAGALKISINTLYTHNQNIIKKTNANSIGHAACIAIKKNLV